MLLGIVLKELWPFASKHILKTIKPVIARLGADNGIRTRDPRLGKPMLYQLSYVRICGAYYIGEPELWQGSLRDPSPKILGEAGEPKSGGV